MSQKKPEKVLQGFSNRAFLVTVMPNQHSPDKEILGFYIPRTLAQRVRKAAKARGLTITSFIEEILTHATRNTILSPDDYQAIAEATKRALGGATKKRACGKGEKRGNGGKKADEQAG